MYSGSVQRGLSVIRLRGEQLTRVTSVRPDDGKTLLRSAVGNRPVLDSLEPLSLSRASRDRTLRVVLWHIFKPDRRRFHRAA